MFKKYIQEYQTITYLHVSRNRYFYLIQSYIHYSFLNVFTLLVYLVLTLLCS